MEPFQELSLDRWPLLKEKLKTLWPLNAGGYYAVDSNIKHTLLREAFHFKIYCPYGDIQNGFVAISDKGGTAEYLIFSIYEDTSKLEEALAKTKLIDWSTKLEIGMASSLTIRLMRKLKSRMEFTTFEVWEAQMYLLDKTSEPFNDIRCPPNTSLAAVSPDHINQVDDVWLFRFPTSKYYLTTLASHGLSYGLYSPDKKLLAWVFLSEYSYLSHLYCEVSFRKKGYAEYLVKVAVNDCLKKGNDVFAYVLPGNQKAKELFTKLGFRLVDEGAWMNVGR